MRRFGYFTVPDEQLLRTRFAALNVGPEIRGGSEQDRAGLVPRCGVAALVQLQPGFLYNILGSRLAVTAGQEPHELSTYFHKATREPVHRLFSLPLRQGKRVAHFSNMSAVRARRTRQLRRNCLRRRTMNFRRSNSTRTPAARDFGTWARYTCPVLNVWGPLKRGKRR